MPGYTDRSKDWKRPHEVSPWASAAARAAKPAEPATKLVVFMVENHALHQIPIDLLHLPRDRTIIIIMGHVIGSRRKSA